MATATNEISRALAEARAFLRAELADGPRPANEVKTAAHEVGIASRTLRRARELECECSKEHGVRGRWLWSLKAPYRPPRETVYWIRAARIAAGLTQVDLANAAGCSAAYVRHLESGAMPQTSRVLENVLAVLRDPPAPPTRTEAPPVLPHWRKRRASLDLTEAELHVVSAHLASALEPEADSALSKIKQATQWWNRLSKQYERGKTPGR